MALTKIHPNKARKKCGKRSNGHEGCGSIQSRSIVLQGHIHLQACSPVTDDGINGFHIAQILPQTQQ